VNHIEFSILCAHQVSHHYQFIIIHHHILLTVWTHFVNVYAAHRGYSLLISQLSASYFAPIWSFKTLPIIVNEIGIAYQESTKLKREYILVLPIVINIACFILDSRQIILNLLILTHQNELSYLRLINNCPWNAIPMLLKGLRSVKGTKDNHVLIRGVNREYLVDLAQLKS
jgi:hypothetical protein